MRSQNGEKIEMEFVRAHSLLHKLAIVDGIGRCGKSLLIQLLTAFESVEKMEYNGVLEYVAIADKFQKISRDVGIAILKTDIDTALYNNMIGRNINTRLSDDTSIYKYHSPEKYIQRSLNPDGSTVANLVQTEKPIYLCWTHDLIHKSDLIFDAFQNKLLFFYINRLPVDLVYEWHNVKNYVGRMSKDPTEMQLCIKFKDNSVPEIAYGWEEEFLSLNPLDRTIKLIYTYFKLNYAGLCNKIQNENLFIFNFEEMISNTIFIVNRLKDILNRKTLPVLEKILLESRCPRELGQNEYDRRKKLILENASKKYIPLLDEANDFYEKIKQLSQTRVLI